MSPGLGDSVYAATSDDLVRVYARPGTSSVKIGAIHQDPSLPALISVDDLLGKHFAVLGTTGAGKSCAIALMLRAILSRHASGHVLLLDLHNEYSPVFGDSAEVLTPETLELPYWLLTFDELVEVVVGQRVPEREPDIGILNECVLAAKRMWGDQKDRTVTVDMPVPYRLGDLTKLIDEAVGPARARERHLALSAAEESADQAAERSPVRVHVPRPVHQGQHGGHFVTVIPDSGAGQTGHHCRSFFSTFRNPERGRLGHLPHDL
jgi:DNA helicase HerA-like ATPase